MIPPKEFCDFEKEPGKLWFRSPMIMNGVCCVCVGYVNLTKLDGTARLEFDNEYARVSKKIAIAQESTHLFLVQYKKNSIL